jgi:LEA14-like dessication related protein
MLPFPHRAALAAFAGLLLLLTGCVPRVEEPDVRLTGVRVAGLGLQGGLLYAQIEVVNPNRFDINAERGDYEIELGDRDMGENRWVPLASGTLTDPIRIGGHDTTIVEVPIEFRYSGLGGALRSIIETGTFQYRVSGSIRIVEPLRRTVPYRHQGVVGVTDG